LKSVFLITIGGVAGQCGGASPLVGRLGNRLFCGVGERSVKCPAGSTCELPAGVCCPGTVTVVTVTPVVPTTTITVVTPVTTTVITPVQLVAKCQSGSPWKDAHEVEYDCGPGSKHSECPAGSECITGTNNAFWACCSLPSVDAPVVEKEMQRRPKGPRTVFVTPLVTVVAKCQIGSPLIDTLGAELFCGTGSTHVDCPVGSQCVIGPDSVFSVCCASPTLSIVSDSYVADDSYITDDSMWSTNSSLSTSVDANATVRYLNIWLLEPTEAVAMWAPPNGTAPASYMAEISYDGNQWRALTLEEANSTFVSFPITEKANFWIRVTPKGGAVATESWTMKQGGKGGKAGKGN